MQVMLQVGIKIKKPPRPLLTRTQSLRDHQHSLTTLTIITEYTAYVLVGGWATIIATNDASEVAYRCGLVLNYKSEVLSKALSRTKLTDVFIVVNLLNIFFTKLCHN